MCAKFRFSTIIYAEVIVKNWFSTGKPLVPGLKLLEPKSDWTVCESQQTPRALCAELLDTFKAPKRVVHFIFLSPVAISAMQPKYGRHSPFAYYSEFKTCSTVQQN